MKLNDAEFLRLSELIEQALDLPETEREQFLVDSSGGDPELARLLRFGMAAMTSSFLAPVSPELRAEAIGNREKEAQEPEREFAPGERVGPYSLIRSIGSGGMGSVWLAERADGVLQRQVALKLPRAGLGRRHSEEMLRERDILASLEHPNIARLYDAGVTESGHPFLAMEFVDGRRLDRYCESERLSLERRLALFVDVARAVAFAHRRLIVHRDLKPANILVDNDGRVRLLDFGIAKLLEDAPGAGAITAPAQRAFTPEYASPEQLSGRRITIASDVYSLGVVLFELLVGRRPFTLEQLTARMLDPSAASDAPLASSIAGDKALRGDLDTIIAKAMNSDPEKRYSNVEAFADDVERHLRREPVHARPPSRGYRLQRFVRRNRVAVIAGLLVSFAIIGGSAISLWQATVARREAERAERVKSFIASIFTQAHPRQGIGGAVTAVDLLEAATARLDKELAGEPLALAELGVLIGEGFSKFGAPSRGEKSLVRAHEHAERELGRLHPLTLHARVLLAESRNVSQDVAGAEQVLSELVPDLIAGLPASAVDCVQALGSVSFVQAKREREDESYASLKQAIEIGERHLGRQHVKTISSIGLLANTYGRFGKRELQLQAATDAMERATAAWGAERPNSDLTVIERWYAEALKGSDRPADAAKILHTTLREQRALDGADTLRVWNVKLRLAEALSATGNFEDALPMMREVIEQEARERPAPNDDRRSVLSSHARMLVQARLAEEALEQNARAMEISKTLAAAPRWTARLTLDRAHALILLGKSEEGEALAASVIGLEGALPSHEIEALVLRARNARLQDRREAAVGFARDAVKRVNEQKSSRSQRAQAYTELGLALLETGDVAGAEAALKTANEEFALGQVEPSIASSDCAVGLARIELAAGRGDEAVRRLAPIIERWSKTNPSSPYFGEVLHVLSRAQGASEGAATMERARALLKDAPVAASKRLFSAR